MSADNQVVVVVNTGSYVQYAATVVQCPCDLFDQDTSVSFAHAMDCFLKKPLTWFHGFEGLERAKQVARLIVDDFRANGWILEYEDLLFVEVSNTERRVYLLSSDGRRI